MAANKLKGEKGEKEGKEAKGTPRKVSVTEEMNLKEMMREMTEVLTEIQTMKTEVQTIKERQDIYQKIAQEQMTDLKRDIREEIGKLKLEMSTMQQDMKERKTGEEDIKKRQEEMRIKVKNIETKSTRMEAKQEELEAKEMEFQLRIRNIQEDANENIREKVIEILAELMECTGQQMQERTDRIYRVNTGFARRNRTARDVIVHFVKKTTRDDILRMNNRRRICYKGKKIVILKELPGIVLKRRRKYALLTEELKRQNIRFRWEREEGLMLTYKEQRFWIKSEDSAKEFLNRIKLDNEREKGEHAEGRTKKKKRTDSMEEEEMEKEEKEELRRMSEEGVGVLDLSDSEGEEIEEEESREEEEEEELEGEEQATREREEEEKAC
nr:trichohyalin-like [Anolis sagrei ordinatus]